MEKYFDLQKAVLKYPPTGGKYVVIFYEEDRGHYKYFRALVCQHNTEKLIINMLFIYNGEAKKISNNVYMRTLRVTQKTHIKYLHDYFIVADSFEEALQKAKRYIDITQVREIK